MTQKKATAAPLVKFSDSAQLPAHIAQENTQLGNENLTATDLQIPQIKLLQKLSPEIDSIEGAKEGLFFNTLDNTLHEDLLVVPCHYITQYSVFYDRNKGGGGAPVGTFPSKVEAIRFLDDNNLDKDDHEIVETGRHVLIILDENGDKQSEALFFMGGTMFQRSKRWNSYIQAKGGPRMAGVWRITCVPAENKLGQKWKSVEFDFVGWADPPLFEQAKALFESIQANNL